MLINLAAVVVYFKLTGARKAVFELLSQQILKSGRKGSRFSR
jgi:hypothetical protein